MDSASEPTTPAPLTPEAEERLRRERERLKLLGELLSEELRQRLTRVICSEEMPSQEEFLLAKSVLSIATKAVREWTTWICTAAENGHQDCATWLLEQSHRLTENFHRICEEPLPETLEGFRAFAKHQASLPVLYSNATERWKVQMAELKEKLHGGTELALDPHREFGGKVPDLDTPINALLIGFHEDVRCLLAEYHRLWELAASRSQGQDFENCEAIRDAFDSAFVAQYSVGAISREERWIMLGARSLAPLDSTNYRKWVADIFGPLTKSMIDRGAIHREVANLVKGVKARQRQDLKKRQGEKAAKYESRLKLSVEKATKKILDDALRKAAQRLIVAKASGTTN